MVVMETRAIFIVTGISYCLILMNCNMTISLRIAGRQRKLSVVAYQLRVRLNKDMKKGNHIVKTLRHPGSKASWSYGSNFSKLN